MRIDLNDLRRHYASLPDGELLSLNRDDLTEAARTVYDEVMAERGLNEESVAYESEEIAEDREPVEELDEVIDDDGPEPDWLEDAASACSFVASPGNPAAATASHARAVLRAARIPSHLKVTQEQPADEDTPARDIISVMVPGSLALHATSILDRDLFNEEHESEWRAHLDVLSDDDLLALDPKIFCAGLLDRVARMRKTYAAAMAQRGLQTRSE